MNLAPFSDFVEQAFGIEDGPWRIIIKRAQTPDSTAFIWARNVSWTPEDSLMVSWEEIIKMNANFSYLDNGVEWWVSVDPEASDPSGTLRKTMVEVPVFMLARAIFPKKIVATDPPVLAPAGYHTPGTYKIIATRASEPAAGWLGYLIIADQGGSYIETIYADSDLGLPWPRGGDRDTGQSWKAAIDWKIRWESASVDDSGLPAGFRALTGYRTTPVGP